MQIQTILDQIDLGAMALPEFQRGYVWNRKQVCGLMYVLYRSIPLAACSLVCQLLIRPTQGQKKTTAALKLGEHHDEPTTGGDF